MGARSSPRRTLDGLAFPIRIKVRARRGSLEGCRIQMLLWLRQELGEGNFAQHGLETAGGDALNCYFRRVEDMLAFLDRFPELELADETALWRPGRH